MFIYCKYNVYNILLIDVANAKMFVKSRPNKTFIEYEDVLKHFCKKSDQSLGTIKKTTF